MIQLPHKKVILGCFLFTLMIFVLWTLMYHPGHMSRIVPSDKESVDSHKTPCHLSVFESFYSRSKDSEGPEISPGSDPVNCRVYEMTKLQVDKNQVFKRASEIQKPYKTPSEKNEVLSRLNDARNLFDEMIGVTMNNIQKAMKDGSRGEKEIDEAKEALVEMSKGREFLTQRIKMVETDDFQK